MGNRYYSYMILLDLNQLSGRHYCHFIDKNLSLGKLNNLADPIYLLNDGVMSPSQFCMSRILSPLKQVYPYSTFLILRTRLASEWLN